MLRLFYLVKPLIPRPVQIRLRRVRARRILAGLGGRITDEPALARTSFRWPEGRRAGILITHDVELAGGQANIGNLLEIERRHGVPACWNFVVARYPVDTGLIRRLQDVGHEVGVHGYRHDGKLFSSEAEFHRRMGHVQETAQRWGAHGFRSPALLHDAALLATLDMDWDSSMPAWDPFQPMPGGCGRYEPFLLNERCVELPVTMWQDFTLFEELQTDALEVWKRQALRIIDAGGLVNVIVHPDYIVSPERLAVFDALVAFLAGQRDCWLTTPSAMAAWVRAEAAARD